MTRIPAHVLAHVLGQSVDFGEPQADETTIHLIEANTAFAIDLYGDLGKYHSGNLMLAPYTVSRTLAMTHAGAKGRTGSQIAEALRLTMHPDGYAAAYQKLDASLLMRGVADEIPEFSIPGRALHIAGGLWGEQTLPFDPAFDAQLRTHYGVGIQPADFRQNPSTARDEINGWIAAQTRNRIDSIVPYDAITPATLLVLASAIYFRGGWESTFDKRATREGAFTLIDGGHTIVPFMTQHETFPYADCNGFQVVEFPYFGSGFASTVILPDAGRFSAVEDELEPAMLAATVSRLADRAMTVSLPKFEFDFATSLVASLQSMGMSDAFDRSTANFAGMFAAPVSGAVSIDDVRHKTFISVDEDGTEAAGTSVEIQSFGLRPDEPLEIRIDRPFLFLIRDTQTGTILFLGRVMDPSVKD